MIDYIPNEEENDNIQWGKHFNATKLININPTMDISSHGVQVNDVFQDHLQYYVFMPTTIATIEQGIATIPINVVVNIDKSMLEVEVETKNLNT